jgi:sulfatase maturation enzyme AslB (radical SAM superfamily)
MQLPVVSPAAGSAPAQGPFPLIPFERVSVELTNRCGKGCWFCYNHSLPDGDTRWTPDELVAFVTDCANHGVKAVSFGGGEPLQYPAVFEVLARLRGRLFRTLTSNGLLLTPEVLDQLTEAAPDKVHLSIHFPQRVAEVERVIGQVHELTRRGIRSGVNFLVARSNLDAARTAARAVRQAGIGNDRIIYLPMRGQDTPTPRELATVAGGPALQSMSCLLACGPSLRFCSVGWDKTVAWCSYTSSRARLEELTYRGLTTAMTGLGLEFCGGTDGH